MTFLRFFELFGDASGLAAEEAGCFESEVLLVALISGASLLEPRSLDSVISGAVVPLSLLPDSVIQRRRTGKF